MRLRFALADRIFTAMGDILSPYGDHPLRIQSP